MKQAVEKEFVDSPLKGKYLERRIDDNTTINFRDLIVNNIENSDENINKIRNSLTILKDSQAVFTNLEKLYLYRYVFTKANISDKHINLSNIINIEDEDIKRYVAQMIADHKTKAYHNNHLLVNKKQSFFAHWTLLLVQKGIVSYSGAKIKTTGLEKLPKDHRYVLVFNHTSMFDPQVISTVLMKEPLVHISKPENFKIPIAGPFMHRDFTLSFKRNDLKYNAKVILKAASYLKEDRFSIGIAPEGTRNKENPSKLLPFNAGVFKLALRGERDIAVVELRNCEKIAKNFPFKKTNVEMNVIDVLKYDDIKDLDTIEISDKIQKILQDKIDKRK
mgnify:CR=1 FL=1